MFEVSFLNNAKLLLFNSIINEIIEKQLNINDAKEKLKIILDGFNISEVDIDPQKFVLGTNIEKFLNEKIFRGLTDISINNYRIKLNLFSEFIGKNKNVQEISKEEILNFLFHREENFSNSKSTLESNRAVLNVFFDWLKKENLINTNPVLKIKPFIFSESNIDTLNNEEIKIVKNSCITLRERALVEFLLSTGCRLREVPKLTLKDINWALNTIQISGKGRRNRKVYLSRDAKNYLKKYLDSRKDDCNAIFVTERRPWKTMSARAIQREVSKIAERTNINKKITPKTFRFTFAKILRENGCPIDIIQSLLGHEEYSNTSETIIRITNDNINDIFEKYGSF